jgi:hypothetical protein
LQWETDYSWYADNGKDYFGFSGSWGYNRKFNGGLSLLEREDILACINYASMVIDKDRSVFKITA